MPTAYIKSLADKGKGTVAELEKKWEKAKALAKKQYPDVSPDSDRYYAIVMGIFKKMAGVNEMISFNEYVDILQEDKNSYLESLAKQIQKKFKGTKVTVGKKNRFGLSVLSVVFDTEIDAKKHGAAIKKFMEDNNLSPQMGLNKGLPVKSTSTINGVKTVTWTLDGFQKKPIKEGKMKEVALLMTDFESKYRKKLPSWDTKKIKKMLADFGKEQGYSADIIKFAQSQLGS